MYLNRLPWVRPSGARHHEGLASRELGLELLPLHHSRGDLDPHCLHTRRYASWLLYDSLLLHNALLHNALLRRQRRGNQTPHHRTRKQTAHANVDAAVAVVPIVVMRTHAEVPSPDTSMTSMTVARHVWKLLSQPHE